MRLDSIECRIEIGLIVVVDPGCADDIFPRGQIAGESASGPALGRKFHLFEERQGVKAPSLFDDAVDEIGRNPMVDDDQKANIFESVTKLARHPFARAGRTREIVAEINDRKIFGRGGLQLVQSDF